MKKLCCISISLLLCIVLGAAFAQEQPQTDAEQTVDLLTLQALDIAPAEMSAEGECTMDELYAMMTGAARLKSGKEPQWSTLPEWVEHGSGDAPVTRLLAARLLFECYEQMGNTIKPDTEPVSYANGMITLQGNVWAAQAECADYDVVMNHMAEVEDWHHTGDWHTAPSEWFVGFAMRQKSRLDDGYMMELTNDDRFRPLDALTRGEAATAVLRLYCSFGRYSDAQAARATASEGYYASIGAEQAAFSTDLLAGMVRKVLHKADGAPVYKAELSRVYALHIAGQRLLDGRMENYQNEEAKYHDKEAETPNSGLIFNDDTSSEGWDFYDLNDFAQFTNLRELTLANQQVTDISGIADLPLEYLDLRWNHFSDISVLHGMNRLTNLYDGMMALFTTAYHLGGSYLQESETLPSIWPTDEWDTFPVDEAVFPYGYDRVYTSIMGDTYHTGGYFFSFRKASLLTGNRLFDHDVANNSMHPGEPLTYGDAMRAMVRLYDGHMSSRYIPLSEIGELELSDEQLAQAAQMPDASWDSLPRWRGLYKNAFSMDGDYTPFFYEEMFAKYAESGVNFIRCILPEYLFVTRNGVLTINESYLDNLDKAIGLATHYRIHLCLCIEREGFMGPYMDCRGFYDERMMTEMIECQAMLARRYASVPNSVLSFNLFNEPWDMELDDEEAYVAGARKVIAAIREYTPERLIFVEGLAGSQLPIESLAEDKVAQSFHMYGPDTFLSSAAIPGASTYINQSWPFDAVDGGMGQSGSIITLKGDFPAGTVVEILVGEPNTAGHFELLANKKVVATTEGEYPQRNERFAPLESSAKTLAIRWKTKSKEWQSLVRIDVTFPEKVDQTTLYLSDWWADTVYQESNLKQVTIVCDRRDGLEKPVITINDDGSYTAVHAGKKRYTFDKQYFVEYLQPWKEFSERTGVAVFVMEWGPCTDELFPAAVSACYSADAASAMEDAGIPWCAWYNFLRTEKKGVDYPTDGKWRVDQQWLDAMEPYLAK